MTYLELIETRAAEIQAEIKRMAENARAELKAMASYFNRSQAQKRRHARQRGKK